jgi:hypothetical protein
MRLKEIFELKLAKLCRLLCHFTPVKFVLNEFEWDSLVRKTVHYRGTTYCYLCSFKEKIKPLAKLHVKVYVNHKKLGL